MKIDEVITKLQQLKAQVGNVEVYTGGTDFPSKVGSIMIQERRDPFVPENAIIIRNKTGVGFGF